MDAKVKKILIVSSVALAVVVATIVIVNVVKNRRNPDDTPQGFNQIVERTKKKHPELYTWWESLTIEKKVIIENSMNAEILKYLSIELGKEKLSEEVKKDLAKYGFIA